MQGLHLVYVPALMGLQTIVPQPSHAPQIPPNHPGHFAKGCFLGFELGLLNQDLDRGALESY